MKVRFIQYLRPNGQEKEVWIDVPNITIAEVNAVIKTGCIFISEVLSTGQVAIYITHPDLGDYDVRILDASMVGEGLDKIIEEMIKDFTQESFLTWKHKQK